MAKKKKKQDREHIPSEELKRIKDVEVHLEISKEDFDQLVIAMMGKKTI